MSTPKVCFHRSLYIKTEVYFYVLKLFAYSVALLGLNHANNCGDKTNLIENKISENFSNTSTKYCLEKKM